MSVCCFSEFFRQKYTHSPCDIITLSMEVYFQMSAPSPEECHTTSGRILDEEESICPTIQAILRLLIKTRQCCRLWASNRMFSALCQWRLRQENCCTNHSSPRIMTNFHLCFRKENCRSILPLHVFVVVSLLSAFFYSWSFSRPCCSASRATHTADMFRRSRQAIIFLSRYY